MHRTRIKFCGMTRVEDALAAAEAGADAIGMVLHADSARRIDRDLARRIIAALPPFVTPVGLFVNAPLQTILDFASDLGLRHIQLHGDEPPSLVQSLPGKAVMKAVSVGAKSLADNLKVWKNAKNLAAILLDSAGKGGSGIENDWKSIQDFGGFNDLPPIVLAGGLNPETVGGVVRMLHPWAVDVSSGIESSKGIKSAEKMAAFVKAVRENSL